MTARDGVGQLTLTARFAEFAATYPDLDLYHRLAVGCAGDAEVAGLLEVAPAGQARSVLLFAAVHDLILRRPELDLAAWYSSVTPLDELATGDPWPTFRETCLSHADELRSTIATQTTQTNEVNRVVLLAVLIARACADVVSLPVALVELGTSAGLLLGMERYRVAIGDHVLGPRDSPVRLTGRSVGEAEPDVASFPPRIVSRIGIDRAPISLDNTDELRWLEACLWPDQPWRIDRFRGAVEVMRRDPATLVTGDLIDDLPAVLQTLPTDAHVVVFDTWALTYVARERRSDLVDVLATAGGRGRALSWASAEPPGCVPDIEPPGWEGGAERHLDTVLGLRRWRDGRELRAEALGWAHPHGNWVSMSKVVA